MRLGEALAEALPHGPADVRETIETGWDSVVLFVGDDLVLRVARNERVAQCYAAEDRLLRELDLPLATPSPLGIGDGWILTRRIPGRAYDGGVDAEPLGRFLAALHAFPVSRARELGVPEHDLAADVAHFRERVLPLLDPNERAAGEQLLEEALAAPFEPALAHGDLGPEHVLVDDVQITGVIDWTDARIGDPALDLAWPLNSHAPWVASPPSLAAPGVERGYPVDERLRRRALLYHALGPWHEVVYGLEHEHRWVVSGLAGVRERLQKVTGAPDTMAR